MIYIVFPSEHDILNRRLPFFLATEEWVARRMPAGNYFFSWQVDPTVICGRNQEIDKEVNLDYCKRNGIDVVRRRSGGGCVFADRQNFMFSFITNSDKVTEVFAAYTEMIAKALRKLGIEATATGRNDITIGEKKVSGNAFYHLPGRSIAHGTMLYDFDVTHLANAITPSKAKLESKGVKSVPMRVTCLKNEGIKLSAPDFNEFMIREITSGEKYILSAEDIAEIEKIEADYYNPEFLRIEKREKKESMAKGKNDSLVSNKATIKGVGEFCIECILDRSRNILHNVRISGDFFMSGDVEEIICRRLENEVCEPENLRKILLNTDIEKVIPGLDSETLIRLFIGLIPPED